MNLSHYSADANLKLQPRPWPPRESLERLIFSFKPLGLWVSVDGKDDWPSWCESECFHPERLTYRYRVTLTSMDHVLHLQTIPDILKFQNRYAVPDGLTDIPAINWYQVKEIYQGIVIAPYQWALRNELMWYYTWDCASGCIWDMSIIELSLMGGRT
jgi:hypothetical protein